MPNLPREIVLVIRRFGSPHGSEELGHSWLRVARLSGRTVAPRMKTVSRSGGGEHYHAATGEEPVAVSEEIRILANDIDREFLEALAERQGKRAPGASRVNRTRERWRQHVERAKRQIQNLGEIEEGSIEQDFKNDRLRALEDAPRSF